MATLAKGHSFAVGEEVTDGKLNDLVDLATISGIVNADVAAGAAIAFSKIVQSNIDGSLLTGLANIVSGAGVIPIANIPSIPNSSLTVGVGTSANNILALNASAKIPAVDGSLLTGIAPSAGTITSTMLKTATGEVSSGSSGNLTLPGGEYGFYPQIKRASGASQFKLGDGYTGTSYTTNISSDAGDWYAQQRYVTASGEDLWIFLLIDKITKEIIASYQAPDHPAYGNGGDFDKVPHPFGNYDETKYEIVLLDKETCFAIKAESKQAGKSILTLINEDYKPKMDKEEVYQPLHSGKFIDDDTQVHTKVMVNTIPSYIKVKKLIKK